VEEEECRDCLAENIRRLARRRGVSVEQLADLSGLSRSTLWAILASKYNATIRTVVRVANALDCRPRDLFDERWLPAHVTVREVPLAANPRSPTKSKTRHRPSSR
jgi:transcriptional regulator with XRE-family HTH domain